MKTSHTPSVNTFRVCNGRFASGARCGSPNMAVVALRAAPGDNQGVSQHDTPLKASAMVFQPSLSLWLASYCVITIVFMTVRCSYASVTPDTWSVCFIVLPSRSVVYPVLEFRCLGSVQSAWHAVPGCRRLTDAAEVHATSIVFIAMTMEAVSTVTSVCLCDQLCRIMKNVKWWNRTCLTDEHVWIATLGRKIRNKSSATTSLMTVFIEAMTLLINMWTCFHYYSVFIS